jgi:integrase
VSIAPAAASSPAAAAAPAAIPRDAYVLPEHLITAVDDRGPRFGDDVWAFSAFVPRTTRHSRVDFTTLRDETAVLTAKEYLYSRMRRAIPASHLSGSGTKPLKITAVPREFLQLRVCLQTLAAMGAPRLSEVTTADLDRALAQWREHPSWATGLVGVLKHLAVHGPFLSADRLTIHPWPGRTSAAVTGRTRSAENVTDRIPEHITGPLIKAAAFYVQTASGDILTARGEITTLQANRQHRRLGHGDAEAAVEAFIARRRAAGRGIPAAPLDHLHRCPTGTMVIDGVVQAPGQGVIELLAGTGDLSRWRHHLQAAGDELGYEQGGLDTPVSPWPDTGQPWRPRLGPWALTKELTQLRTACWLMIAYLSGMRDGEVRELGRDCAFTEPTDDGRIRYKLRGRVYKDRRLTGEQAEWVVLEIVHQAVAVLARINDDPTHLFGYRAGRKYGLMSDVPRKIGQFRDHCNKLFTNNVGTPYIPDDIGSPGGADASAGGAPWAFNTRQFRRTLAWHLAHQPFGVVAGAKQYKHAQVAMFEGYAGTSASGFAAEVAAEQAVARLDYLEDLYRDWDDGGRSGGGATARIDAEFHRIRRELDDLPGVVASPSRLRTMLTHLTKTLHPGVLGDCFYQREKAVCAQRGNAVGRPLPLLNMCSSCPNARRATVHLPRLTTARDQARQALQLAHGKTLPPLQQAALAGHAAELDELITQIHSDEQESPCQPRSTARSTKPSSG